MEDMNTTPEANPVIHTTTLRAYPGWVARQYADRSWDAADTRSPAVSPVLRSFTECVRHASMETAHTRIGSR